MTTTTPTSRPSARTRHPAVPVMWIGLVLTVLAAAAPLLDRVSTGTIEAHVRATYPQWPDESVQADTTALVVGLAIFGTLGIIGWLLTIRAVLREWRWARGLTTAWWLAALTVTFTVALAPADPYEQLAPIGIGLITILPCLAGLVAVVQLWRHRPRR